MGLALVVYVVQYQKRMMQQADDIKSRDEKYQEELIKALVEGQEKERTRIAGSLHDGLGAQLSTIRLNVLLHGEEQLASKDFAENVAEMLSETIDEVRNISHALLPGALKMYGLDAALKELSNKVNQSSGLKMALHSSPVERMNEDLELALYRLCQELVNNTLKHARAKHISLHLKDEEAGLNLVYEDDGIGFDSKHIKNGLGMYTLHSRLDAFKGSIEIESSPGKGMKCIMNVPKTISIKP